MFYTSKSPQTPSRSRTGLISLLAGFMVLLLSISLFGYTQSVNAQATVTSGTTGAATTASTQTSGTTITVFCLDYGKDFPTGQTIKVQGLASDKVRGGLTYALSKGYVTTDPYQVQLALWHLQDNQPFHDTLSKGTTIAQEIVTNAGSAPSGNASSVSNLTLTNIQESSPKAAYGSATVQGDTNTSGLPVGFLLPASGANFQNLVAVVATGNPTTIGGQGQGGEPAAPATGMGGSTKDGANVAAWLVALLSLIGLTTFGLSRATRKSR